MQHHERYWTGLRQLVPWVLFHILKLKFYFTINVWRFYLLTFSAFRLRQDTMENREDDSEDLEDKTLVK